MRRLVGANPGAGIRPVVRRGGGGDRRSVAGASHPICRLCGVATGVAAGRSPRSAPDLLEAATGRRPAGGRTARRPPARGGPNLVGQPVRLHLAAGRGRWVARAQPAAQRDPLHDPVGRLPDLAHAVYGGRGCLCRYPHRLPDETRDGRSHRLFCEYPRAAYGPLAGPDLPWPARAGT
ncbi:MAG: hypothetical protein NBKEAIPA_01667 [Nitrospirae bacterium]|nr:hypothetical protein [Nitrospirota bacterium]